jgi:prevent-host-death family protein
MPSVTVAEAKSHLSELIAKSAYSKERFIITRHNKPVAALVSMDDLQLIEQAAKRKGLASLVGKWKGFDEVASHLDNLESLRSKEGSGRDVPV